MAHQDYVAKKRTPKKRSPYKNKNEADSSKVSMKNKLLVVVTIIIILLFSAALWFIKTADKPVIVEKNVKAQTESAVSLPKPPTEKWSYMEELKTKQVEEGHYDVKQKGPYQMQCGSFRTQRQAESLKAKIAFVGIEAIIRTAKGKSGLWYKVVLGPYDRKRLAEKDKHKLRSNKVNGCQIWLWQ